MKRKSKSLPCRRVCSEGERRDRNKRMVPADQRAFHAIADDVPDAVNLPPSGKRSPCAKLQLSSQLDPAVGSLVIGLLAARRARNLATENKCRRRLVQEYGVTLMFASDLTETNKKGPAHD